MQTEKEQLNGKRVTLKDLAKYTGLAPNTVSRVLNRKPYYTKQVEDLVNDAVKKFGYITDSNAAALKSGNSKTIAIIYDDMVSPFYSYMTSVMAGRFNSVGYDTIIFSNYGTSAFLNFALLRKVLARNPVAIVSFIEPEKTIYDILRERKLPFIIFGRDGEGSGFDCVCADEVKGGELAAQHLIECGFKDICFVGYDAEVKVSADRLQGYKNILKKNGLPICENLIFTKEVPLQQIIDALIPYKKAGIVCYNDKLAFRIYQEMVNRKMNVPNDFGIVGYDNIQAILELPNLITTIDVDNHQMADVGAEVVLLKLQNDEYISRPFKKVLLPKIVKGNTT